MTSIEKVAELFSTEMGQRTYIAWAEQEITGLMMSAIRELAQPGIPASSDAGAIGLALGKALGAAMVVDYLAHPYRERVATELAPGYGADEIMRQEEAGYGS